MNTIISILEFVLIVGFLAFIHELGHFIAAKLTKTEVSEFGLGVKPRMVKLFTWQGTAFTLNWIPFGGFVQFKSPENATMDADLMEGKTPWQKLFVLSAGSVANLLTGFLLCLILVAQIGVPQLDKVEVVGVSPNSPAALVNLKAGDQLQAIDSQKVDSISAFQEAVREKAGESIEMAVLKNTGETESVTLTPRLNPPAGEGAIGIVVGNTYRPAKSSEIIQNASRISQELIVGIASFPATFFQPQEGQTGRIVGIKGLFDLFDNARQQGQAEEENSTTTPPSPSAASNPANNFQALQFIIVLAFGLGVMNLMPIPALDGGRMFFVFLALIFRKPAPPRIENAIHSVGYVALLLLMFYVTIIDFINPII